MCSLCASHPHPPLDPRYPVVQVIAVLCRTQYMHHPIRGASPTQHILPTIRDLTWVTRCATVPLTVQVPRSEPSLSFSRADGTRAVLSAISLSAGLH